MNWSYHDYVNADIKKTLSAIEDFVENRELFAVRIGVHNDESIYTNSHKIIDFSTSDKRSDFLDIYLSANCRFLVCGANGVAATSEVFRRPICYVNWTTIKYSYYLLPNSLFIPKKMWLISEKRYLTLPEFFEFNVDEFLDSKQFIEAGIEVIENTENEILDAINEMESRLNGCWQTTDEEEILQKKFVGCFKKKYPDKPFMTRIGAKFLRENADSL